MSQYVNLYRDDVVLRAERLDARTLLRGLAALAGVLLLLSAGLGVREWLSARSLAALQARVAEAERGVAELEARHARVADTAALDAELARIEAGLISKQVLLGEIQASSANRSGFSTHLHGLALGKVAGLWLESFALSHGGETLALHGRALRPEQVPDFMLELGRRAPFAGTEFEALVLERPEAAGSALRFELRTAEPKPAAPEGSK